MPSAEHQDYLFDQNFELDQEKPKDPEITKLLAKTQSMRYSIALSEIKRQENFIHCDQHPDDEKARQWLEEAGPNREIRKQRTVGMRQIVAAKSKKNKFNRVDPQVGNDEQLDTWLQTASDHDIDLFIKALDCNQSMQSLYQNRIVNQKCHERR